MGLWSNLGLEENKIKGEGMTYLGMLLTLMYLWKYGEDWSSEWEEVNVFLM